MNHTVKITATLLVLILLGGCTSAKTCERFSILQYEDFGPQAMAHPLMGMQWWQWKSDGSPDAGTQYDIKVIVHPDSLTEDVRKDFPVVPTQRLDYRYVTFENAYAYLNHHIEEDLIPTLTAELKVTRAKIDKAASCKK